MSNRPKRWRPVTRAGSCEPARCLRKVACMRPLYQARTRIETLRRGISQAMADYARLQTSDPCQK